MNSALHYGIVLRSYAPYQHKFVLLDRGMGMIDASIAKETRIPRIGHGMLISYTIMQNGKYYRLENVNLVAGPAKWVRDDIVFFHHTLELAQAFLSYHQVAQDVFELFIRLYKPLMIEKSLYFKRCFLCKFFMLLVVCPEDEASFSPSFFNLISSPLDIMVKSQSVFRDTTQISRWLQGCIAIHPDARNLKTMFFLTQMDDHDA